MSIETIILVGILLGLIFGVFLIFAVELIVTCIGDFLESLFEPKEKVRKVPKKIYPPKSQQIQDLIKLGKARIVSAPHFIENNLGVKSRLKFNNHEEKCEFLTLCDIVEVRDGFITDFEVVNLLNSVNKINLQM